MNQQPSYYLLPHVRCVCGKVTGHMQDKFESLIRAGLSVEQVYEQLGIDRYCCKQTVMSPIIMTDVRDKQDIAMIEGTKGLTINPIKVAPSQNIIRQTYESDNNSGMEQVLMPTGLRANIGSNKPPAVKSSKPEPYVGSGQIMVPEVNFDFGGKSEAKMVDVGSGLKVPILQNRAFHAV